MRFLSFDFGLPTRSIEFPPALGWGVPDFDRDKLPVDDEDESPAVPLAFDALPGVDRDPVPSLDFSVTLGG